MAGNPLNAICLHLKFPCYTFATLLLHFVWRHKSVAQNTPFSPPLTYHFRQVIQGQALTSADGELLVVVLPWSQEE